ncbi:MAG: thioredoxin fold domain-containing protein [Gammaproteobacteria bacterium]
MNRLKYLSLLLTLVIVRPVGAEVSTSGAQSADDLDTIGYHEQPAWFKDSFLDLQEDVDSAHAEGRRVLYYFYQNGCPYCKKLLDVNFSQRDISEATKKYFDLISINIWGDREVTDKAGNSLSEKQFARDLDVDFTPTLLFMNEKGDDLIRLNGYYPPQKFAAVIDYVGRKKEASIEFAEYWKINRPKSISGKLYQHESYLKPPYNLVKRNSKKPLLILFEQKDCLGCDELHQDIFERKESQEIMADFDVVLLDIWADMPLITPKGATLTAKQWAKVLDIQYTPTLVMFDVEGREVFRTDAYLKAFHTQSAMDYVRSGAYLKQESFQRYLQARVDALEAKGFHVDIMK